MHRSQVGQRTGATERAEAATATETVTVTARGPYVGDDGQLRVRADWTACETVTTQSPKQTPANNVLGGGGDSKQLVTQRRA